LQAPASLSKGSPEFLAMLERLEMLEEDADMKEAQVMLSLPNAHLHFCCSEWRPD
jgi:hypothetical protein